MILIFWWFSSSSQQNIPLKFKDYEPVWKDFIKLEGDSLSENCHYDLRSSPRLIDDSLYVFYNIINYGYNGFMIEKRNIKDGSKYWRYHRDTLVEKRRLALSQVSMDSSKINLVLFDEDKYLNDGNEPDWAGCHPANIVFDRKDGKILSEYHTDHSDPDNILLETIGYYLFEEPNIGLKLIKTSTGFRQIYYLISQKKYYITDVNNYGHLLKYDTLSLWTAHRNFTHRISDLDDSTFISVIVSTPYPGVSGDSIQIMYRQLDHNLNIKKQIHITNQIPDTLDNAKCYRFDNGYFIIVSGFQAQDNSYSLTRYYLFDKNGVLKDRLVFTLTANEKIVYGWLYPLIDYQNEKLILTHSRQDTKETSTYFELFTSNGDKLKLLRRFEVEGIEDHFRVNYGTILPSGDLLLYINQFDWNANPQYPYPVDWQSWMLMSKADYSPSINTDYTIHDDALLYPNPTSSKITIDTEKPIKNVIIYDSNANKIGTYEPTDDIDLKGYSTGIYNVMIMLDNGAVIIKRIVVQ